MKKVLRAIIISNLLLSPIGVGAGSLTLDSTTTGSESINIGAAIIDLRNKNQELEARLAALEDLTPSADASPVGHTYAFIEPMTLFHFSGSSHPSLSEGSVTFHTDGTASIIGNYAGYWWNTSGIESSLEEEKSSFNSDTDPGSAATYKIDNNRLTLTIIDEEGEHQMHLYISDTGEVLLGSNMHLLDDDDNTYIDRIDRGTQIFLRIQ